jgi:hypothetical protein
MLDDAGKLNGDPGTLTVSAHIRGLSVLIALGEEKP